MRGHGSWAVLALALLVFALAASAAFAQTHQEPVDLEAAVGDIRGDVPYAPGDGRDRGYSSFHDERWGTRAVPGLFRDAGDEEQVGWYRIHLRVRDWPREQLAVVLPPIYGGWQVWFNGRLLDGSGDLDAAVPTVSEERHLLIPLDSALLRIGSNVLALRVGTNQKLSGVSGGIRVGSRRALERRLERRGALTLGVAVTFLLMALIALALWATDRTERLGPLLVATLLGLALYSATNNGWWYYFIEDTASKFRLRYVVFFGLHCTGMLLVERLFLVGSRTGTRVLAAAAMLLAILSIALPMGPLLRLQQSAWLLTGACVIYALGLGRDLPLRSPTVKGGVRAAFVGLLLAILLEVAAGIWHLPGTGPFEAIFLVLICSIGAVFAVTQARSQSRAVSVLRSSRDGLAVLDLRGGVELSNPALEELLGVSQVVLKKEGFGDRLASKDRLVFDQLVQRLSASAVGAGEERTSLRILGAGGTPLNVEVLAVRLDDLHVLLSLRDLTERNRLEEEVQRAQRLDSLGMLAGGIAHDFNNLLAGILVSATELEQERLPRSEWSRRLRSISESARRGGALTSRLLQFARGRISPTVGVDLEGELPDMLDMLARTLGRNLEWIIDIEPDLPAVRLDEAELEQILVNLCVNARDAMAPQGGTIEVSVWVSPQDGAAPLVALKIQDSGRGMKEALMARVFEPFVTTKGSGAGTGLGLAVVHGLVTSRGGQVHLTSQEGEGTAVTLLLPVLEEEAVTSLPEAGTPTPTPEGTKILLVEDEPALRKFLSRALERRGLDVTVLPDGQAVMEFIEERNGGEGPPVDAVVMDMMMPVVDGMEATTALRERWVGLPVVISSGYTGRESIEPLLLTGPTLLLEKPYQVDDLLKALSRVMA
jgi:PAS domain S-box-containing protein